MIAPLPILGGANERLLPASVPFRFFAAAAGFQVLAWAMLFWGAPDLPGFAGGTGPVLAALHLLTLGVLVSAAMGAAYQLLPVATRSPIRHVSLAKASFWLLLLGVGLLTLGMAGSDARLIWPGAVLVALALALFAGLTAQNLWRAHGLPMVVAHGWTALVALVLVVLLALLLIVDEQTGFWPDHAGLARLHMVMAVFGFMGILLAGFSLILVPMFALSSGSAPMLGRGQLGLGGLALVLATAATFWQRPGLWPLASALGAAAAAVYLWHMRLILQGAMRRRLGLSFVMIRAAWAMLALSLVLGVGLSFGLEFPGGAALFGVLVLPGWLLTFLGGVLQRIVPFLASMHVQAVSGAPALLSDLTPSRPLLVYAVGHFSALALLGSGVIFSNTLLVRVGALAGFLGALAFVLFLSLVLSKLPRRG